jgi:hypothetical protein
MCKQVGCHSLLAGWLFACLLVCLLSSFYFLILSLLVLSTSPDIAPSFREKHISIAQVSIISGRTTAHSRISARHRPDAFLQQEAAGR